jgi:hypothetical protein
MRIGGRGAAALAGFLLVVVPAGCGSDQDGSGQGGQGGAGGGQANEFNALTHPDQVPALIRSKLGDNPTLRRLSLSDNGFSMEVRDPKKPENLDTYSYHGGRWTSTPVFMSVRDIEELDKDTFRLSKVDFDLVPQLLGMAAEGLDLEGEQVTGISYDRIPGDPVRVYVSVRGLRGAGHLLANADGTNAKVTRD